MKWEAEKKYCLEFSPTERTRTGKLRRMVKKSVITQTGKYRYRVTCSGRDVRHWERFCRQMNCSVLRIYEKNFRRSSNYRKKFFDTHKRPIGGWRCRYCGRRLRDGQISVDHLYPVGMAKASGMPGWMQAKGIYNVNDPRNLVPACERCNRRKGSKAGLWVVRGRLGGNPLWNFLRRGLKIILIAVLLFVVFWVFSH